MSYLVPKDEVTVTDIKVFKEGAIQAGIRRAKDKLGRDPSELVVRQFLNIVDVAATLEQWNTAALAAVGTAYTCFNGAAAAPTLAQNRLIVFYKVGIETVPCPVSRLTFRKGGATGNVMAEFDLEQIINGQTAEGFFNEPVIIDPTDIFAVQVTCRIATGVVGRVQLGALVIEPVGQIIA